MRRASPNPDPPAFSALPAVVALLAGLGAAALTWRDGRAIWLAPVIGLAVTLAVYVPWTQRDRRRRRLAKEPFPAAWRRVLEEQVHYYAGLGEGERRRFEREVRFFLAEHTVTGPRGAPLDDELRVLVAASAVVLVFGRPGFRYPRLRDVVVYDEAFDDDYQVRPDGQVLGMVHAQGPILFSARSLRQGFRAESDGHNVGFHEFAHVLDFDRGETDGVPTFMPWRAIRPWLDLMCSETTKIEKGRSILRRYAATNEAELFAVATEMFFERPARMRDQHPELYALMMEAYGQDPAGRTPNTAARRRGRPPG